jgi:hypothetical protein
VCVVGVVLAAALCGAGALGVVGGQPISIKSAPWSVSVRETFPQGEYFTCSGSIIDAAHVLTAAHCLFSASGLFARPAQISIEAGVSSFTHPRSTDAKQQRTVRSVRVDPGYVWRPQPTSLSEEARDIAVLTLSQPLDLSGSDARAVALPTADASRPVEAGFMLAGFGGERGQSPSGALEQMHAKVFPAMANCSSGRVLCGLSRTSSPCPGDSGAGLVASGALPTLVGLFIVSTCTPNSWSYYVYISPSVVRGFIHGHSPSGAPPSAPATRWVPSGWTSHSITDKNGPTPLVYSLPRTWSVTETTKDGHGITVNPQTHAESGTTIFPKARSRSYFFDLARTYTPKYLHKQDPNAVVRLREETLPGAEALEIIAELTLSRGGHSYRLRIEHYLVFHDGVGYDIEYQGPLSKNGIDIPVFRNSAQTIHFSY